MLEYDAFISDLDWGEYSVRLIDGEVVETGKI